MPNDPIATGRRGPRRIGRRELLKRVGAGVVGASVAAVAGPVSARAGRLEPSARAAPMLSPQRAGGTITLGTAQDFPGMDPMVAQVLNSWNLHTLLWNGLTRYDELMEVQPDLAERWEIPDTQTFVFYLRRGARFHHGREVTADDVKFSIERVVNPETKSSFRPYVDLVQSVDAVDRYTVKVNLSKPNVIQAADLTYIKIMPQEAVADAAKNPVGTGPYQFVEFVPGDHVTLKRFDGYWDPGKPAPDQFIIRIVKDEVALYNAFKAGQFDIIWQLSTSNVKEVSESQNLWVVTPKVSGNSLGLQVDCSSPPFNNKSARQALLYATDKESIFDLAYFDIGWLSKTNSGLAPNHWAFNPNLREYPYDLQRAKELFRDAGVKEGYTIRYNALSGPWREWIIQGEILRQSLKECGISLDIRPVDLAEWVAVRPATGERRAWPDVISPNGVEQGWDPAQQLKEYKSYSSRYNVNYSNPEVDALLEQGLATLDRQQRTQIYYRVQEILSDEVPWITTHHRPLNHAAWKHIQGLYVDGQGTLHFEGAWTEKQDMPAASTARRPARRRA